MAAVERRGDTMRGELVARLSGVLVAPIDREDLFRLSRSIDDVLDNLRDFIREWDLYGSGRHVVSGPARRHGRRHRRPAARGAGHRQRPQRREDRPGIEESAGEIRRLYDDRARPPFRGKLTMEVVKCRELLRRLDVVGLRLNEAADRLSDAAVKRRA